MLLPTIIFLIHFRPRTPMTLTEFINRGLLQISSQLGLAANVGWKMVPDGVKESSCKAVGSLMELEKVLEQQIGVLIEGVKAKARDLFAILNF